MAPPSSRTRGTVVVLTMKVLSERMDFSNLCRADMLVLLVIFSCSIVAANQCCVINACHVLSYILLSTLTRTGASIFYLWDGTATAAKDASLLVQELLQGPDLRGMTFDLELCVQP